MNTVPNRRRPATLLLFALLALVVAPGTTLLAAHGPTAAVAQTSGTAGQVRVVASFSILGDWVGQVGGDRVALTTIVGAGGDAHTFDPSPDQVAGLAEAGLLFAVGAGFEPWLDDMVAASGSPARRVDLAAGLDLIAIEDDNEHEGEAEAHAGEASPADSHEHANGAVDPHIWHDAANAMTIVGTIRDELSALDPANAATYAANAERYLGELRALDAEIQGQVATLPAERRRLVTSHDTFAYFARAYGFDVVGTALGSVSTEAGEPSAQAFAELVSQIEAAGVPAIFAENVANPDLMQAIADEAGVALAPPLYTDALSESDGPAATYVALMRANVTTIVTALAGG